MFGPQSRTRSLGLNSLQRKMVLCQLFAMMNEKSAIYCLDHNFVSAPSTKQAYNLLRSMGAEKKKCVLFLPYDDVFNYSSFRNIPYVSVFSFDQPNAFDLSGASYWMFLKKDLSLFKDMVAKWM